MHGTFYAELLTLFFFCQLHVHHKLTLTLYALRWMSAAAPATQISIKHGLREIEIFLLIGCTDFSY
jgi:hypothetical protein